MDSTQRARNGLSSNQFQFTRTVREDDGEEGRKNTMASSSAEMTPKPMTDMLSRHRRQQQPKPQITNTIQQYNVYNSQTNEQNCSLKMPNLTPIRVIGNGAFGKFLSFFIAYHFSSLQDMFSKLTAKTDSVKLL